MEVSAIGMNLTYCTSIQEFIYLQEPTEYGWLPSHLPGNPRLESMMS